MVEMPEGLAALIRAQGKYDVDEIAARAEAVVESGLLDEPGVDAEPRQTEIVAAPPGDDPTLLDMPVPVSHGLDARSSDPAQSHSAGRAVAEREGKAGVVNPDTDRCRALRAYGSAEYPLTDTQAGARAGIRFRSCGWKRCGELLEMGLIRQTGVTTDEETGSQVRLCAITLAGTATLKRIDRKERTSS